MNSENQPTETDGLFDINRRNILKSVATASAFTTIGVGTVQAGPGGGGGRPEYSGDKGDLVAAQNNKVGEVTVELVGSDINVTYDLDDPWCLWRTHVDIDYSGDFDDGIDDIPLTNSGNPKIGNFEYSATHLCADEYTYSIPVSDENDVGSGDTIIVAAHAEVVDSSDITCSSPTPERLYLTDSNEPADRSGTVFYEVELDDSTMQAKLHEIDTLPAASPSGDITDGFSQVDCMAATPDGEKVYFYDKFSANVGVYNFNDGSFTNLGSVSNDPDGVVLGAFSPHGTFYVASGDTDTVYTLDLNTLTLDALANSTGIDLDGADMVFTAEGTLYLWTKSGESDPVEKYEGLWTVDLDPLSPTQGEATAVDLSNIGEKKDLKFTGLAVRDAGTGTLVGSDKQDTNDRIVPVDKSDGTLDRAGAYPMYVEDGSGGWVRFEGYDNGDMTVGPLCEPANETAWAFQEDNKFPGRNWGWYLEETL